MNAPSDAGAVAPPDMSAAGDGETSIPAARKTSKLLFMPLNYQRPKAAATKNSRQAGASNIITCHVASFEYQTPVTITLLT